MLKKIDVHSHFYPADYLKELSGKVGDTALTIRPNGDYVVSYKGDYNIVSPPHRNLDQRLLCMDQAGITQQVLSMMTPGVHLEELARGVYLAQTVNDAYAEIIARYPSRFLALAVLPLQDPEAAATELERAVDKLGLHGGLIFTNVNGKTLDDPSFDCLFETAARLSAPLLIHPTTPQPSDAYLDYRLVATVGFPFDTTIAVARMIFSGLLDRVPEVKLIIPHLGGCLPYLSERMDRGYKVFPECGRIQRKPSEYIKEFFFDCVHFDPNVIDFAVETLGSNRLLVGSDYPAQIGDIVRCVQVFDELPLTITQKENILFRNAQQLFRI